MARRRDTYLTRKEITQAQTLLTKIRAGMPIKETEWPAWARAPKPPQTWKHSDSGGTLGEYLANKGITEDEANPAAIYWEAYDALERGERCESCGRPGPEVCRDCGAMLGALKERSAEKARMRRIA